MKSRARLRANADEAFTKGASMAAAVAAAVAAGSSNKESEREREVLPGKISLGVFILFSRHKRKSLKLKIEFVSVGIILILDKKKKNALHADGVRRGSTVALLV